MNVFSVYERDGRNLKHVADLRVHSLEEAREFWDAEYGENYGKVVILSSDMLR
tara:strand:- start:2677 stop:2835 length:159 start_codon:yes stop_codon:yes gene_type:complete